MKRELLNPFELILETFNNELSEVKELLKDIKAKQSPNPPEYVYSLKALSKRLGYGINKTQNLKNDGTIPFIQNGRKLIFNVSEVLEALREKGGAK